MGITILPKEPESALSQMLTGLGTGLGTGLQEGIKEFQELKRTEKGLESIGLSKDIARLPPELQKLVVSAKLEPEIQRAKSQQQTDLLSKFFPQSNTQAAGEDIASGNISLPSGSPQDNKQAIAALSFFQPQTGRILEQQRKVDIQERRATHADSKEFFNKVTAGAEAAQETMDALEAQEDAIKTGEIGRLSAPALADALGIKFIRKFVESPESKVFRTAGKQMFSETKELFGAKPLGFEVMLMKEMQAEIGVSDEANLATISTLKKNGRLKMLKGEIARELTEANGGFRSPNFESMVNREYQARRGAIKNDWASEMHSVGFGKSLKPTDIKLQSVPQGTPVNEKMADLILFKANGDVQNAEKLASQLGYQF